MCVCACVYLCWFGCVGRAWSGEGLDESLTGCFRSSAVVTVLRCWRVRAQDVWLGPGIWRTSEAVLVVAVDGNLELPTVLNEGTYLKP